MRVVIFCGGYGTRMWPASRKSFPKQFYPLINGKSFFELTYERFRIISNPSDIFVSTEEIYTPLLSKLKPEIPQENIITEPERKDNLAAIGLVCTILEKRFPGESVFVSWSDHFIDSTSVFLKGAKVATQYAQNSGLVVSLNEEPKFPSTNNEWVKLGEVIDKVDGLDVIRIEKLIKRPDLDSAKKMYRSQGKYLINTGYRAFRTDVMLSYYQEFAPQMYQGLSKISQAIGTNDFKTILCDEYHNFQKDTIEFSIFVKVDAGKNVTIPLDFGWRDAGTWELFFNSIRGKNDENVVEGTKFSQFIQADNNLVVGMEGKMVALIGVRNLAIIDTKDALLVTPLNLSAKVKDLFSLLEDKNPEFVE